MSSQEKILVQDLTQLNRIFYLTQLFKILDDLKNPKFNQQDLDYFSFKNDQDLVEYL